jgi:hypothetical protein
MIEMAANYNENINNNSVGMKNILMKGEEWMELNRISTKELQRTLKVAKNKISAQDFNIRLGTIDYRKENIIKFRQQCKNVKLRHIYFRLISKDFFTMEKMFKYRMVNSNKCMRCDEIETYKHLIWECEEAKRIWHLFNELVVSEKQKEGKILDYDDVFKIGSTKIINKVKIRVIQAMIQIERPVNWTQVNITRIINEIRNIESCKIKLK